LADYRLENNVTDETGTYPGTGTSMQYSSSTGVAEGTYSGYFADNTHYFESSISYPDSFTFSVWTYCTHNAETYVLGNTGYTIQYDGGNDRYHIKTVNGASITDAYTESSVAPASQLNHLVAIFRADSVEMYVNGSRSTSTSTVESGYNPSGTTYFAVRTAATNGLYGWLDRPQFYDGVLTSTQITNLYNDPTYTISTGASEPGYTEPNNPSANEIEMVWFEDFEDYDVGALSDAEIYQIFGTLQQKEHPENLEIVEFNGNKVLKAKNDSATCCLVSVDGRSAGGFQFKGVITENVTYDELYGSVNLYYPANTEWVKGAKMPIFGFTSENYLGRNPVENDEGWKINWMTQNNDNILCYSRFFNNPSSSSWGHYVPNEPDQWGMDNDYSITLGAWTNYTTRFGMNTDASGYEIMELFIDGVLKYQSSQTSVDWEMAKQVGMGVKYFWLNYFYGGNDATYFPEKDEYVYIDDIAVFYYISGQADVPYNNEASNTGRTLEVIQNWKKSN